MKLILAAGAMVLAAGAADAAVIRYMAEIDATVPSIYTEFVDGDPFNVIELDPNDAPLLEKVRLTFDIDTKKLGVKTPENNFYPNNSLTLENFSISDGAKDFSGFEAVSITANFIFNEAMNIDGGGYINLWAYTYLNDGFESEDTVQSFNLRIEGTWSSADYMFIDHDANTGNYYSGSRPVTWTKETIVPDAPSPIPLPASGLLLAGALGMIGLRRRVS